MSWEPMLRFDCNHDFIDEGPTFRVWVSSGTNTSPPNSAPLIQKIRCRICGGIAETVKPEGK